MSLSASTRFTGTVASIMSGAALITGGTWYAANAIRDITDEVKALRREVRASNAEHWTITDMKDWSRQLERINQTRGLILPEISARPSPPADSK